MARIETLDLDDLEGEHVEIFDTLRAAYGTLPSSFLTLGRMPALLEGISKMSVVALGEGRVSAELKWMLAHMASRAAGCSYCSAHTGFHASTSANAPVEKIEAIWEYETSDLFSEAEVAALRVARAAGVTPNQVTDEDFAELREHFDDDEIVELVAPIALFGFLNRWNDTLSTDLEKTPFDFATEHLSKSGWAPKPTSLRADPST
jgi:uncharacterized peroxidase-related enzyme